MRIQYKSNLKEITGQIEGKVNSIILEAALSIRQEMETVSPVLSGALASSFYISMPAADMDDYDDAKERVRVAASDYAISNKNGYNVRLVAHRRKAKRKYEAVVGSVVEHATYVEFGTSRMAARPNFAAAFTNPATTDRFFSSLAGVLNP